MDDGSDLDGTSETGSSAAVSSASGNLSRGEASVDNVAALGEVDDLDSAIAEWDMADWRLFDASSDVDDDRFSILSLSSMSDGYPRFPPAEGPGDSENE